MDRNQARARIIEVGQLVKQALSARGVNATDEETNYKCVDGVKKLRRSPFWSNKRGYKYIDDVEDHLRRLVRTFEVLNPKPGSSVFEIGPGNCYFLFLCRELRGCRVAGVDIKQAGLSDSEKPDKNPSRELSKYAYHLFREHFGLGEVIKHQVICGNQPIDFGDEYDAIVATRAVFNRGWREGEYRFWLRDCHEHLRPEGRLMFYFNKVAPEHLAVFPFLRPAQPTSDIKKLSMNSREAIGLFLGEHRGG